MLKAVFTPDYEINGDGEGCPNAVKVEPTRRMLVDQFGRYDAKLTIMADAVEIQKFKQYKESVGRDDYHYDPIAEQLKDAVRRGHDVQLHDLHAACQGDYLPFSKLYTRFNERTLPPFLAMVQSEPTRFGSAKLADFDPGGKRVQKHETAALAN